MSDRPADTILVVDDDENIVFAFRKTLERQGYRVVGATNGVEALDKLETEDPSVVYLDISMPGLDGLSVLERIREDSHDLPVIVITGYGTMQTAIRAVQLGAFEYMTKPLDVDRIRVLTDRALKVIRLQRQVNTLEAKVGRESSRYEMLGNDPAMQEVYKFIGAVTGTPNSTNVLIRGESGTGKELVARAIHLNGQHPEEPFVAINCTVLPESLLESELFGHEKGAFTNAHERKLGKFELAGDGVVFLDEIGDMPMHLQQKLLRVVEERSVSRLGGNTSIPIRARFICATNRDLEDEIRNGRFREDLYFRLNVLSVELPPLRERIGDVPLLASHFVSKYARRFGKDIKGVSAQALNALSLHPYPGNVRELENLIERAVTLERGDHLSVDSFPPLPTASEALDEHVAVAHENLAEARRAVVETFERRFVVTALKKSQGNVTLAARRAGIERQSFQRLMKKYAVRSEEYRSR